MYIETGSVSILKRSFYYTAAIILNFWARSKQTSKRIDQEVLNEAFSGPFISGRVKTEIVFD